MDNNKNINVLIIGAGPSGLALAYELIQINPKIKPIIIEKLPCAGGIARTIYADKSGIDIGGHRLTTKNKYIEEIWKKFLTVQNTPAIDDFLSHRNIAYPQKGADPNFAQDVLLIRKSFSSIIKNNKKYSYPLRFNLKLFNNLGIISYTKAVLSYIASLFIKRKPENLENSLINKLGKYLYNFFFKDYCSNKLGVNPSLVFSDNSQNKVIKNLFSLPSLWEDEFYYPKQGCSQLWDKMAQFITKNSGEILYNTEFIKFEHQENKVISADIKSNNTITKISADYFVSSIPISELIKTLDAPYDIKQYALNLPYRAYVSVSFFVNKFNIKNDTDFNTVNNITPDNRIYLTDKNSLAQSILIMNNWSPYIVEDFKNNYLITLEYYCNYSDNIWNMSDNEISRLAITECEKYNFFTRYDVNKTKVIREQKAIPVNSGSYEQIDKIKEYLKNIKNLYLIGRNSIHQHINTDSAMVRGINIAREINEGCQNGKQMP